MQRPSTRANNELRIIKFTPDFTQHAEGSVLVEFGQTRVLCTASVVDSVPRFLKGTGKGWLTAEYGMLPRSTHDRIDREASRGRQNGRTLEIQRLIGRSLRTAVDLKALEEKTIYIDCDVLQADGGTRTASISGGCVALQLALKHLLQQKKLKRDPTIQLIASVSVGIYEDQAVIDLDYAEDSNAQTDMNVVMNDQSGFIEIQGTAEGHQHFDQDQLNDMLNLAKDGIGQIIEAQKQILSL